MGPVQRLLGGWLPWRGWQPPMWRPLFPAYPRVRRRAFSTGKERIARRQPWPRSADEEPRAARVRLWGSPSAPPTPPWPAPATPPEAAPDWQAAPAGGGLSLARYLAASSFLAQAARRQSGKPPHLPDHCLPRPLGISDANSKRKVVCEGHRKPRGWTIKGNSGGAARVLTSAAPLGLLASTRY